MAPAVKSRALLRLMAPSRVPLFPSPIASALHIQLRKREGTAALHGIMYHLICRAGPAAWLRCESNKLSLTVHGVKELPRTCHSLFVTIENCLYQDPTFRWLDSEGYLSRWYPSISISPALESDMDATQDHGGVRR
ncbi:hypothetical protein VTL71DRAFT_15630 [Oculimacula yallundae]|uniref:Uncharacterized protein n=1 Tax=Oculimacula yallundae TaxID=86028 RepID=A0ABR4CH56_9HELO